MTKGIIKTGVSVGNGAAINVELGFVPTRVELYNATDGTLITIAFLQWVIPFTSGGTNEMRAGSVIRGVTSGASAQISDVLLYSGSFITGDAAGFLVVAEGELKGTFGAENVAITNLQTGVPGTDDATVTANVVHNCAIAAAAGSATGTSAISRYEGVTAASPKGFTIGSALAVEAKCLRWTAIRDDG